MASFYEDLLVKYKNKNFERSRRFLFPYSPEAIKNFLNFLGNPQNRYTTIHIGGSIAKGYSAYLLSQFYKEQGYKVATYLSPHLEYPEERFLYRGEPLPRDFLNEVYFSLRPYLSRFSLSFFDTLTVLAFYSFALLEVDYAVIEVGLGGRLDSTSVISPEIALLTPIIREHTRILGRSLLQIAKEKVPILQKAPYAYSFPQKKVLTTFIREYAPHTFFLSASSRNNFLEYNYSLIQSLLWHHYRKVLSLPYSFYPFKGRKELLLTKPKVYFDMAHTPYAVYVLLSEIQKEGKIITYFQSLVDKPYFRMLSVVRRFSDFCFFFPVGGEDMAFIPLEERIKIDKKMKISNLEREEDFLEVLEKYPRHIHVILGSSYLYPIAKKLLRKRREP